MVEFKTIEFLLQLPNLLPVCSHAGFATVRLSHDLIDDMVRVSVDVKSLNPEFSDDAQMVDQHLVLNHVVGCAEV
jgi:hypothetical protein